MSTDTKSLIKRAADDLFHLSVEPNSAPRGLTHSISHSASLFAAASNTNVHSIDELPSVDQQINWPEPQIPPPKSRSNDGPDYLKMILTAKVYDAAIETPLHFAPKLSAKLNNRIYLKREDLQPIFSFKCRGAYNKISNLSKSELNKGIICCSAGNHAQGVALAAKKMGIEKITFIVMPKFAPEIKVDSVRRMGVNIILHGNDFDEAKQECFRLVKERGYTFIPPYDDPYIIAGQGTTGVELFKQIKQNVDGIFIGVGGGGLLAGVSAYAKRIHPETKIIGVNTFDSDSMFQSLQKGNVVTLDSAGLFSDGTSIRQVGAETFRVCQQNVDDFVLVTTDEICAAIKDTFDETRTVLEPSGALAVAGMKKYLSMNLINGGTFAAITSGANMNFDRLRFVADRARIGEGKEILLSVTVPEQPGSLLHLYQLIQPRVVTEFSYRYNQPTKAAIFIAVEVTNTSNADNLLNDLKADSTILDVLNITDNEMAKSHVRFLIGGRTPSIIDEVLLRFRFPERPGALMKFLTSIKNSWNISLFQYKNNGSDLARILVGVQVPKNDRDTFMKFLGTLGYQWVDETDNPVYQTFLN